MYIPLLYRIAVLHIYKYLSHLGNMSSVTEYSDTPTVFKFGQIKNSRYLIMVWLNTKIIFALDSDKCKINSPFYTQATRTISVTLQFVPLVSQYTAHVMGGSLCSVGNNRLQTCMES
jgi:hypothetical protein